MQQSIMILRPETYVPDGTVTMTTALESAAALGSDMILSCTVCTA